jgi:hypothetical protein
VTLSTCGIPGTENVNRSYRTHPSVTTARHSHTKASSGYRRGVGFDQLILSAVISSA